MIMCLFLFGVALHFSTVARREAFSFFELAGVTANIHSLYTGHGYGMGIHHDTKFGLGKEGMAPRWDVGGGEHNISRLDSNLLSCLYTKRP